MASLSEVVIAVPVSFCQHLRTHAATPEISLLAGFGDAVAAAKGQGGGISRLGTRGGSTPVGAVTL